MDQESIVYGCIKDLPCGDDEDAMRRRRVNRQSILMLPSSQDDDWPFLCSPMFAVSGNDVFSGTYNSQIIHFGMSYKAVEYEWEAWISKFEDLLRSMYWVDATVHLETELSGKHTFRWDSPNNSFHSPDDGELRVRCEWEHESSLALKF
jgi:hypothetical protein